MTYVLSLANLNEKGDGFDEWHVRYSGVEGSGLKHTALLLRRSRLLMWSQQAGSLGSGKNRVQNRRAVHLDVDDLQLRWCKEYRSPSMCAPRIIRQFRID